MGTGADRAAEVNESFLGIPGYADDTFFFVIRYVEKAKVGFAFHCHDSRSFWCSR